MNRKPIALALASLCLLAACATPPAAGSGAPEPRQGASGPLTDGQKREDLAFLCENLEQKHINLYHTVTKEEFAAQRAEIERSIPGLDDDRFYLELKKLTASVADEHTFLNLEDADRLQVLPLVVDEIDGGWYVRQIEARHAGLAGDRITAIGGVPMDEVFNRVKPLISSSTEAWMVSQFCNYLFVNDLRFAGAAQDLASATLTLQNPLTGEERELTLPACKGRSVMDVEMAAMTDRFPRTLPDGAYYRAFPLDDDAYFLQYNACVESPDLAMKDFIKQVEADLKAGAYRKLLVDLRYNGGGDSRVFEPMIERIGRLQGELGFQTYALIGRGTMSSAMLGAIQLHEATGCLFAGSPTGGSVNGYGELQSFQLPNLPATVYYSVKYFEMVPGYDKDSLYPDIPVEPTFQDTVDGVDAVVERVLAL